MGRASLRFTREHGYIKRIVFIFIYIYIHRRLIIIVYVSVQAITGRGARVWARGTKTQEWNVCYGRSFEDVHTYASARDRAQVGQLHNGNAATDRMPRNTHAPVVVEHYLG